MKNIISCKTAGKRYYHYANLAFFIELISNPDSKEFLEYAVNLNLHLFMELPRSDTLKHLSNREQLTATIKVNIMLYFT